MSPALQATILKWQAIGRLLIGQQPAALDCFDRMLALEL